LFNCLFFFFLRLASAISIPSGLTIEEVVVPGQKLEGAITLESRSDSETVRLYQTDYLFYADGSNFYSEPGTIARSNASWISIYPKEVSIPPGMKVLIHYQIVIPENSALSGTYWSMIMVEPYVPPAEALTEEEGKVSLGIRTVKRYGIQIVTHIGDSGTRELKIVNRQLAQDGQNIVLALDIENTGERWLIPALRAEIYDETGNLVGKKRGTDIASIQEPRCEKKSTWATLPKASTRCSWCSIMAINMSGAHNIV